MSRWLNPPCCPLNGLQFLPFLKCSAHDVQHSRNDMKYMYKIADFIKMCWMASNAISIQILRKHWILYYFHVISTVSNSLTWNFAILLIWSCTFLFWSSFWHCCLIWEGWVTVHQSGVLFRRGIYVKRPVLLFEAFTLPLCLLLIVSLGILHRWNYWWWVATNQQE